MAEIQNKYVAIYILPPTSNSIVRSLRATYIDPCHPGYVCAMHNVIVALLCV